MNYVSRTKNTNKNQEIIKQFHQIDSFRLHNIYLKFVGLYPGKDMGRYYKYYSFCFLSFFIILYVSLSTINFYFAPTQIELFVQELILYFSEIVDLCKALTILAMKDKILLLLDTLECDMFQPDSEAGIKIIDKAKKFNIFYWKIVIGLGYFGNFYNTLFPILSHFLFGTQRRFPICSYSFIPETIREKYFYQLYAYQIIGVHFHMLVYISVHCYFVGFINFIMAQLDVLDYNLRKSADMIILEDDSTEPGNFFKPNNDDCCILKLNKCIIHFDKVAEYCDLVEEVFSVVIFVSFSLASTTICVCLFRLTLPSTEIGDCIFLVTYILMILIVGILVPCWLGTQVDAKSRNLTFAAYSCNWTDRSRRFKSSLRIFIERTGKPLTIDGLKMFSLSLVTFTAISKSAYSFFTLLRFMQSRESTNEG